MMFPDPLKVINKLCWSLVFLLASGSATAQKKGFVAVIENKAEQNLKVRIDGALFTSLLYADSLKKHVLYPVILKGGLAVTRGWPIAPQPLDPVDHPHQIGVWFNYGDVNGADYWNNSTKIDTNKKAYGTIRVREISGLKSGKGAGKVTVTAVWYNPGGKAVLEEQSDFTFRDERGLRIIERTTRLRALTDVLFRDNKEGLFGIRVSPQLQLPSEKAVDVWMADGSAKRLVVPKASGEYESSAGIKGESVFATRSGWLKLSGSLGEKSVSIVLMDHPQNVNYPGFWMARGYGLFAINPLGAEVYTGGREKLNFSLKTGEYVLFRHSLLMGEQLTDRLIHKYYKLFSKR